MGSANRLFVTPDELRGGVMPDPSHPHGGEGKCGGNEGHGSRGMSDKRQDGFVGGNASSAPSASMPRNTVSQKSVGKRKSNASSRNDKTSSDNARVNALRAGIRMSVVLGEPKCRSYMASRRGFGNCNKK